MRRGSDRWLEALLAFIVGASLVGLATALAGVFQGATMALAGLAAAAFVGWRAGDVPASGLRFRHALVVLLIALPLRLPVATYLQGGQDPGVYTGVAAHLARTGSVQNRDEDFTRLLRSGGVRQYVDDNYGDPFLPGVYALEGNPPRLVFQFYHLFPAWMALAIDLGGLSAASFALVFLALASLLFFQRLALALTGSHRLALTAGVLLALNPLHAFFSRFPVTEVPTLAFSSAAFAMLARYALAPAGERRTRWLVGSALAFACLFLTRVSGFMYLPIVLLVGIGARLFDEDRARARGLEAWSLGVLAAYVASVAYGLAWSGPYARRIYEDSFVPLAGVQWPAVLAIASVLVAIAWLALQGGTLHAAGRRATGALLPLAMRCIGPVLVLLTVVALAKGWRLGFAAPPGAFEALRAFPGVVGAGWLSVAHLSLAATALYLGPLAFLAFLAVAHARLPTPGRLLLLFVACFFAYAALLNWVLPYQPYYGRYLASELVPYALLLLVCALAWLPSRGPRIALAATLAITGAGYLALDLRQAGPAENTGAQASFAALAAWVGRDDVLVLDNYRGYGFEPKEIKAALAHGFGRHVVLARHRGVADLGYLRALDRAYGRVLLASAGPIAPHGFRRVGTVPLRATGFARSPWPAGPRAPMLQADIHLFVLEGLRWTPGRRSALLAPDARARTDVGDWRQGLVRADGRAGILLARREWDLPAGRYRLVLRGVADGRADARLELRPAGRPGPVASTAVWPQATAGGTLAALTFDLAEPVPALDVVVSVEAGSALGIEDYVLTRLR